MNDTTLLDVKNIHAGYGANEIIHGISLTLKKGNVYCIIGPNGCGKSTFLKSIFGFLFPTQGQILFQGEDITHFQPQTTLKKGISFVMQRRSIFPDLTIDDNIQMGGYIRQDKNKVRQDSDKILDLFPNLKKKRLEKASNLSGGEARMLEIARALVIKPKLILLDEPSAGLAPKIVQSTLEHLVTLKQEGITLLVVEQKIQEIFNVADYGFVFGIGKLKNQGSIETLRKEEELEKIYFS